MAFLIIVTPRVCIRENRCMDVWMDKVTKITTNNIIFTNGTQTRTFHYSIDVFIVRLKTTSWLRMQRPRQRNP